MTELHSTRSYFLEPTTGDSYEGRQYGWILLMDDYPYLRVTTGGTGPCWNIDSVEDESEGVCPLHACDLDELIGALEFLRASPEHAANVERWK